MKDRFQKTLLKGTLEIPFENIANLDPPAFDKLTVIDRFLIGDTLLTYTLPSIEYPFELYVPALDKYPFAPYITALQIGGLKKNYLSIVTHFVTKTHIKYQRLFHPALIVMVLEDCRVWDDVAVLLPKVLRERARWLSSLRPSWKWWNNMLKQAVWQDKNNPLRFQFLRILRIFKPEEANLLLSSTWDTEENDSKKMILDIVLETIKHADQQLLNKLYGEEKGKFINRIRCLLFMSSQSLRNIWYPLIQKSNGNIETLNGINYNQIPEFNAYFSDENESNLYPEVLISAPYELFKFSSQQTSSSLGTYLMMLKNKNEIINDILISYLINKDTASFSRLIDDVLANDEIKLNYTFFYIFSSSDVVFINDLLLYMICLLYTSPSPRDRTRSRMPSSA